MNPALPAFAISLAAGLLLTIPVRALALRIGMVDQPGPRKVHSEPIPLLGGLAIYGAVLLGLLPAMNATALRHGAGILAGGTLVAATGILDDRGLLHHQIKLFVAMPLAAVMLIFSGIQAQVFRALLGGRFGQIADIALTIFWVVGITAAFSILDHMDGICAGSAMVASSFYVLLARQNGQTLVALLAAAVLGAALGFLRWNFKPARIFMGDGGAMFLGFLMATLGLLLRGKPSSSAAGWIIPVFVLLVPIFDTTLVIISRTRRGLLPFASPGKDHCAHRLANLGLGQRGAVLTLYGVGTLGGLLALLASRISPAGVFYILGGVCASVLAGVALLERAPYERQVPR